MSAEPASRLRERIAERIRHGVRRWRSFPLELDPGPDSLPAALRQEPPPSEAERKRQEAAELEQDVREAHALYELTDLDLTHSPRRVIGSLLTRFRTTAQGSLPLLVERQTAFNAATARAVSTLRNRDISQDDVLDDLRDAVLNVLEPTIRRQAQALLELERTILALQRELLDQQRPPVELDQLSLVNRFRGSEESVRDRQQIYLEHFLGRDEIVDLACGRGEFLELLREADVPARGVELDPAMVEYCLKKGLDVERREAVAYLEELPGEALGGVFAGELIEHLEATDVVRLVRASHRVLREGGVLVLETPNPETLITFAEFFVDPTHVRPYHPETMRWLLESEGFEGVDVRFSVPAETLLSGGNALLPKETIERIDALLFGFRTYAVIGAKRARA
jgi:SAM-dependent methyltransferase